VSNYALRKKDGPENFVLVAASGWNFRRVC